MGSMEEADPAAIMQRIRTKVLAEIDRMKTQDTKFSNHKPPESRATPWEARNLESSYPFPIKPLALKVRRLIQREIQWTLQSYLDEQRRLVNGLLTDMNDLRKLAPKPGKFLYHAISQTPQGIFVSERIIENAFALRNLPRTGRILDVGCCESDLCIQLATMGFQVFGIDTSNCELTHRNFHFLHDDIRETPFQDGYFDAAIAISSIEHVGLGHYGDPNYPDGDLKAMKEIHRILKEGGLLILTTPFGAKSRTTWERVYDNDSLAHLLEGFEVQKIDYWIKEREDWRIASLEEAKMQNHDIRPAGDDYPLWPCIVTLVAKRVNLDR